MTQSLIFLIEVRWKSWDCRMFASLISWEIFLVIWLHYKVIIELCTKWEYWITNGQYIRRPISTYYSHAFSFHLSCGWNKAWAEDTFISAKKKKENYSMISRISRTTQYMFGKLRNRFTKFYSLKAFNLKSAPVSKFSLYIHVFCFLSKLGKTLLVEEFYIPSFADSESGECMYFQSEVSCA